MRASFTFLLFCFAFIFAACEHDKEIDNPDWVDEWIQEIKSLDECFSCEIHRYEFEGEYYYELYSPIFSCMLCQVHFADGEDVDWVDLSQEEYLNKRKNKVVIYKRGAD